MRTNIQKRTIAESELILNSDGSIYHLKLKPGQVAKTIILVGDQNRVSKVSSHFDEVELKVSKREFVTHTGTMNGKRISVVSTGIGTDNIDIVVNELDALFNVDFTTRMIKEELTSLNLIRIGTSGTFQKEIPVDSFLVSEFGLGIDSLFNFYKKKIYKHLSHLENAVNDYFQAELGFLPFLVPAGDDLLKTIGKDFQKGITLTAPGFYGPQGRHIRAEGSIPNLIERLAKFEFEGKKLTNFEMETSGIYGLSSVLGHQALSANAILANRATGEFSKDSAKSIRSLIKNVLSKITESNL